jgi:hypothetical protein
VEGHRSFVAQEGQPPVEPRRALVAVTQIRNLKTEGHAYYERKLAEGKTGKETLRALKRRISESLYAGMVADAAKAKDLTAGGPGGQTGNGSIACAAGSHPAKPALRPKPLPGQGKA